MPNSTDGNEEREQRLNAIVAEYYRDEEAGKTPDHNEFIAQHPEFAKELTEFFADIGILQDANVQGNGDSTLEPTIIPGKSRPTKSAAGQVVRYFGEYEILEKLGAGGMGVVYKARQTKLKRIVALKMIRSSELANSQDVQRFEAEAKAAAKLSHPGIVSVHEVGIHNGQHFYTMDYVEGGSLSRLHRDQPVASKRASKLVRRLAESMHYAHKQGIVHRDLKPANILLTAKGAPRITDFGLAKRIRTDDESHPPTLTETGAILGTAGYMSPEQAAGKSRLVGPSADIYSLGAVLYALLTSRAPFVGETPSQTIMQVLHKEPVSPRTLNPSVPRDLETICLKCLQKEPHKRYGTAQLLAEDLALFLEGKPVKARPVSSIERTWRWCRRNSVIAGLLATLFVSLLIGTGVSWYFKYQSDQRAENERDARKLADQRKIEADRSTSLAEARLRDLEASERLSRRHLYCAHMSLIQNAWDEEEEPGRADVIVQLLERQIPAAGQEDVRSFEWHYWHRRCNDELLKIPGSFWGAAYNVDGTVIATGGRDKMVKLWDAATGAYLKTLEGHDDQVEAVSFSRDGQLLASASRDETVRVWDVNTGMEKAKLLGHKGPVLSVAISPDGKMVASGSTDGTARVWDPVSGEIIAMLGTLSDVWEPGYIVAFSPDGETLALAQGHTIQTWGIADNNVTPKQNVETDTDVLFCDVAISPDGARIATGDSNGRLALWDAKTGQRLLYFDAHLNSVSSLAFSPDGLQIASGAGSEDIKIWDTFSGKKLRTIKGNRGHVNDVAFSPNGTSVAAVNSGVVRILETTATSDPMELDGQQVSGPVAFSADGSVLAAGNFHGDIALWDTRTMSELKVLKGSEQSSEQRASKVFRPIHVAFHPDGSKIASSSPIPDWSVLLRSVKDGGTESVMTGHKDVVSDVSFSPDGSMIASSSHDQTIKLWNTVTAELIRTFNGHSGAVKKVVFSPDGQMLASASEDGCARIWNTNTGLQLHSLEGQGGANSVAFSPSGKLLAIGHFGKLKLWNFAADTEDVLEIPVQGPVYSVAFTPDGQRVAASSNGPIRLWDTATGDEVLVILTPAQAVLHLAFSPDGSILAANPLNHTVFIWEAKERRARHAAGGVLGVLKGKQIAGDGHPLTNVVYLNKEEKALFVGFDRMVHLLSIAEHSEKPAFVGHDNAIWTVAVAPDGSTAVTGSEDKTIRFWDVKSGKEQNRFNAESTFSCVRFSADGDSVFAANWDRKVRVWRRPFSDEPKTFNFDLPVLDISLMPDGKRFVVGTLSGVVLLCDVESGVIQKEFNGHSATVHSVAVVDSEEFVSASHDQTLRLWNVDSTEATRIFRGHSGVVNEIRTLPDSKRFLSCGADRTLRLWDVETGKELARGIGSGELRGLSVAPDGKTCLTAGMDGSLWEWELPETVAASSGSTDGNNPQMLTSDAFQADFIEKHKLMLRPKHVFVAVDPATNQPLYAIDWGPADGQGFIVHHGMSDLTLEQNEAQAVLQGYQRAEVKTVTIDGVNHHIGFWTK